jgi:hypothetical protein
MENANAFLTSNLWNEDDTELLTPIEVTDEHLRKRLLDATLTLEKTMAKAGSFTNEIGLKISISTKQKHEDKPIIYLFEYSLDADKWKKWVTEHAYLLEDNMGFTSRGIQFTIPGGGSPNTYKNVLTSIKIKNDSTLHDIMPFDLLTGSIIFAVHKNIFNDHEWVITRIK